MSGEEFSVTKILRSLLSLFVLVSPLGAEPAQSATPAEAELRGTVRDTTRDPLAGAKVTIANAETGSRRTSQTDSRGRYVLKAPPGTYRVSVDLVGFVGEARSDVTLRAAQPQELDFRLRLAGTESSQALRP
jgi:hypothetical protein